MGRLTAVTAAARPSAHASSFSWAVLCAPVGYWRNWYVDHGSR